MPCHIASLKVQLFYCGLLAMLHICKCNKAINHALETLLLAINLIASKIHYKTREREYKYILAYIVLYNYVI